jgi:cyclophilin family peptidyl-prolyl cis-trans isomerase
MVSVGRNTIGSQFCITLDEAPYLDGRYTVVGRIVEGKDFLERVQKVFTFRGLPSVEVVIEDCGAL